MLFLYVDLIYVSIFIFVFMYFYHYLINFFVSNSSDTYQLHLIVTKASIHALYVQGDPHMLTETLTAKSPFPAHDNPSPQIDDSNFVHEGPSSAQVSSYDPSVTMIFFLPLVASVSVLV